MRTHNIPPYHRKIKEILIMPPDLALLSTLIGSNYPGLELIFMFLSCSSHYTSTVYTHPYDCSSCVTHLYVLDLYVRLTDFDVCDRL